jgi:DNA-binding IclR family transcriptional regulator
MPPPSRQARKPTRRNGTARYRVEAVARAARLLRAFTAAAPRHAGGDIAKALRVSPAIADRTLATLAHHGLLRQTDDATAYELGLAWLQLADIRRRQVDVRLVALPVMRRVRDAVNETVILAIRLGNRRVNIDYVESTQQIRRLTQPGFEAPLHIGATGRALLSGLSATELDAYLASVPLVAFASAEPVSKARLLQQIEDVRRHGYARALREITSDTAAVAAPIRDHTGATVAALTISCPEERFTAELEDRCIRHVAQAAHDVSHALGHDRTIRTA